MTNKKRNLGQYFTKGSSWMLPQVEKFINDNITDAGVVDPFAGGGDLLKHFDDVKGFDIDPDLEWEINDGLLSIPETGRLVITNPPYLAKNSAKRRGLDAYKYFEGNDQQDLFMIGLDNCIKSHDKMVAIIPESFLTKKHLQEYVVSFSILEDNPFADTTIPTAVVCFSRDGGDYEIYQNDEFIGKRSDLDSYLLKPDGSVDISFNHPEGNAGVLGYDVNKLGEFMTFCHPDIARLPEQVKGTDRATSRFKCDRIEDIDKFILEANRILQEYRDRTGSIFLPAFNGNNKNGERRRSLSMKQMRAITERAVFNLRW